MKEWKLTSQVAIHDFDHHGVGHPVVSLPDRLAFVVDCAVDGLYQAVGAEEREVHDDFAHLLRASIVGMAQLIVRTRGPIGYVEDFFAYKAPHWEAVKRVAAQERTAGPDRIHFLALLLAFAGQLWRRKA